VYYRLHAVHEIKNSLIIFLL